MMAGIKALADAASALQGVGAGTPINKQIDAVSNALTGAKRERALQSRKEGYPPEVQNVLEILKMQVAKAVDSLSRQQAAEQVYSQLVEDLEIVESFADRILKFYQPGESELSEKDEELAHSLKHSFAQAKAEAVTTLALEKVYQKIDRLEERYRNSPNMTSKEYRAKLDELSLKVRKWEDELLPGDPALQDSRAIAGRVQRLKSRLNNALEVSHLRSHPGVLGEKGLDILRVAAGMVQQAQSQFEVEQGVMMALDANKNLRRSGESFQEKGRTFNLLIQQSIAVFVNRQVSKLEHEMKQPTYFIPGDIKKNQALSDRLVTQMKRLIIYFEFVDKWAGPHQEDLLERIALVYESIVDKARKAKQLILNEASKKGTEEQRALKLAEIAARYRRAESMGRDLIKPHRIFNEDVTAEDEVRELLEKVPDPAYYPDQTISMDKLGRAYHQVLHLRKDEHLKPETKKMLNSAMSRIELHVLRHKAEIDIFVEMEVRSHFMKGVLEQEVARFMVLIGMDPSVTAPARYEKYPEPSEYPFKGRQLAKVINNFRILDNFLAGRYGNIEQHTALIEVSEGLYKELEGYSCKVMLELMKRLKFTISQPPSLNEIEANLTMRFEALPDKIQIAIKDPKVRAYESDQFPTLDEEEKKRAEELQELWLMLEYLKFPGRMKQIGQVNFMARQELIKLSQTVLEETDKELVGAYYRQIKQDLGLDRPVSLPFEEEDIATHTSEVRARRILKRFIQLHNPKMQDLEPFSDQLLAQCRVHKKMAEKVLIPLAFQKPELVQKVVIESLDVVIADSARIQFELHPHTITDQNAEDQFRRDHQVAETLPLYVQGLTDHREQEEGVWQRLLSQSGGDEQFAEMIASMATRFLFEAPLSRIQGLMHTLSTLLSIKDLEVQLEDCTQFLTFRAEGKECQLTGFGQLSVQGPLPETGHIDEIGSLIMKTEVRITKKEVSNVRISFINEPYNAFISNFRKGQTWNLL